MVNNRKIRNLVLLSIACIIIFLIFWVKSGDDAGKERGGVRVKVITAPVVMTQNDQVFEAVGTGRARLSADIYPAISEEVREVLFSAEQQVKKGDVLVQLDDRQEVLAVRLAKVRLKNAKSLLTRFEQAGKKGAVPEVK